MNTTTEETPPMAELRVAYSGDPNYPRRGHLTVDHEELIALRDLTGSARPGLCHYGCDRHPMCRLADALASATTVARSRTPDEQDADEAGDPYERRLLDG